MALTFFWRCEATALTAGVDYSAGDTSAGLVNSGAISSIYARTGTNSLQKPASFAGGAQFTTASIYPGNVGSMAFSIYSDGSVTNTSGISIQRFLGTDTANYIDIQYRADGSTSATNLGVRMARSGGSNIVVAMSGDTFTPNAWFGVVVRWDIPNDLLRIELYNAAGILVDSAENSATDLSTCEPVEVGGHFQCGAGRSTDAWATYTDGVFVANTYDEPLQYYFTLDDVDNYSSTDRDWQLLGVGSWSSSNYDANLTPGAPGGSGGVLLLHVEARNQPTSFTTPTGWTVLSNTNTHRQALYARVATGEADDTPTVASPPGTDAACAVITRWIGTALPTINQQTTSSFAAESSPNGNIYVPAITPTVDACLVLRSGKTANDDGTWTAAPANDFLLTQVQVNLDADMSAAACYRVQGTAAAVPAGDITNGGASIDGQCFALSLIAGTSSGNSLILPHRSSGGMIDLSGNFRG